MTGDPKSEGVKTLPFGSKAMLLIAGIVKQLSCDNIHPGLNPNSNQY